MIDDATTTEPVDILTRLDVDTTAPPSPVR